jgi:hypothetical protein
MLSSLHVNREKDSCRRLFVNVNTGRFMRKDMSMLRGYTCISADVSNGLLVLKAAPDSNMWILNPFTGYLVRLPLPWSKLDETLTVVELGWQTKVVYSFWASCHVVCAGHDQDIFTAPSDFDLFATMVSFQSCAYAVDWKGTVTVMEEEQPKFVRPLAKARTAPPPLRTYIVDNAGELLLVRLRNSSNWGARTVQVFRVDLEGKALHKISSIGNRALFLDGDRCRLSVDPRNLPGIEGNCIYFIDSRSVMMGSIWMYRLVDGSYEKFYESPPCDRRSSPPAPVHPITLPQALLDYPKYAPWYGRGYQQWTY